MANLSEEEALALMAVRGHCEDLVTWKHDPEHQGICEIASGVQDEAGARRGQYVHLHVTQSSVTGGGIRFLFTLFRETKVEKERIYQLDLRFGNRKQKGAHRRSHEHLGTARIVDKPECSFWEFEHALARFCQRSNIYLMPIPPSPFLPLKEKGHAHKHR